MTSLIGKVIADFFGLKGDYSFNFRSNEGSYRLIFKHPQDNVCRPSHSIGLSGQDPTFREGVGTFVDKSGSEDICDPPEKAPFPSARSVEIVRAALQKSGFSVGQIRTRFTKPEQTTIRKLSRKLIEADRAELNTGDPVSLTIRLADREEKIEGIFDSQSDDGKLWVKLQQPLSYDGAHQEGLLILEPSSEKGKYLYHPTGTPDRFPATLKEIPKK